MKPYTSALERFAALGVDTDAALSALAATPISLHCWQGDDVAGFEGLSGSSASGCLATGDYPGKARGFEELSADLDMVARLIPGPLRLNLHACYASDNAERGGPRCAHDKPFPLLDRMGQAAWLGYRFQPHLLCSSQAADGFTLAHRDPAIRRFWIDHCIASRRIGAEIGERLGTPAVTNIWIPDGYKDTPANRSSPRARLSASLEEVFCGGDFPPAGISIRWRVNSSGSVLNLSPSAHMSFTSPLR